MKAKSIFSALGSVLPALLAALPVTAQVQFASLSNSSLGMRDKLSAISMLRYYGVPELKGYNTDLGSILFPSLGPTSIYTTEESRFVNKTGAKTNDPLTSLVTNTGIILPAANIHIGFKRTSFVYPTNPGKDVGVVHFPGEQLLLYAVTLKQYAQKNGYDTTYALLSNMGMLNSTKRMFIVNLVSMQIEQSGFVAQGRGMGTSRFDKQYSNSKDSKCTSLGRYKIMKKYKGEYGIAYKMMGLDSTNCNAYKRNIVLHSMGCMPDMEGNMPVCISEGCPAVSERFLSALSNIIDSRKKPLLLWIFDSNLEEIVIEQSPKSQETEWIDEENLHRCLIHKPRKPNKSDW